MGHGAWGRSVFLTETRHYCRDTATLTLLVQSTFIFVEMKIEIAKAGAAHRNISK